MSKHNEELLPLNTHFDEEEDFFNSNELEIKNDTFKLDTSVADETDEFFHEFNKPNTYKRKQTKQDILHEFKKINTKMNPQLHKMLKIYCSQNDFKKNDVFKKSLETYIEKNRTKTLIFSNEVNGTNIDIELPLNLKKSYNFELKKNFFKEVKTFSSLKEVKLMEIYEQAIIDYLHTKRFKF